MSRREAFLTIEQIALGFLAAGTLGVVASALLEIYLLPATTGTLIGVGVIEELGRSWRTYGRREPAAAVAA